MQLAGWNVAGVGIFPASFFPREEWGPLDIVPDHLALRTKAGPDMIFADFDAARTAAHDKNAVETLWRLIGRVSPDVIQVEHPWTWLVLREALPSVHNIRIIYSSHSIESRARSELLRIGTRNPALEEKLEASRVLEEEFARTADLVFSISDIEAQKIQRTIGRKVIYLPAASDLASQYPLSPSRIAPDSRAASRRYAAFMSSANRSNIEGFFNIFPEGLGFLAPGEEIWIAGLLGSALQGDQRFKYFQSINDSRTHIVGYIEEAEKARFFSAARCVIVPATRRAGTRLKTADAVASGLPVIATQHAIEGYGTIVKPALGNGVYVADTPKKFRSLVREALRKGLAGCEQSVRSQLSFEAMSENWARYVNNLLAAGVAAENAEPESANPRVKDRRHVPQETPRARP